MSLCAHIHSSIQTRTAWHHTTEWVQQLSVGAINAALMAQECLMFNMTDAWHIKIRTSDNYWSGEHTILQLSIHLACGTQLCVSQSAIMQKRRRVYTCFRRFFVYHISLFAYRIRFAHEVALTWKMKGIMWKNITAKLFIFARNTKIWKWHIIYAKCIGINSHFVLFSANNLWK